MPRRPLATAVCWFPPLALSAVAAALWLLVDRWWLIVPLGYGPRWLWLVLVPIPLLAAVEWRPRLLATGIGLVIAAWGILGWRAPLPWRDAGDADAIALSVVSFNAALSRDATAAVLRDASQQQADLVVVVECPRRDLDTLLAGSYRHARAGE